MEWLWQVVASIHYLIMLGVNLLHILYKQFTHLIVKGYPLQPITQHDYVSGGETFETLRVCG
jgi:hypothetical protein